MLPLSTSCSLLPSFQQPTNIKQFCPPAPVFDSLTQTNSHSCWNFEQIPTLAGTQTNSHLDCNCKNFPPRLEEVFLSVARGEFHFLHSIGIKVELQSEANIYRGSFIDTPIFYFFIKSLQEGEIADMKFFFEKLINTGFLEGSALKSVIG